VPADLSSRFNSNNSPELQVILDGRKSAATQIAKGYIDSIVDQFSQDNAAATINLRME
jgi:ABC-2 type transport system permease protein